MAAGVLGMLAGLVTPISATANEWLGLTGVELGANRNIYAFAGAIAPLTSDTGLGQGWVQRYWLDWLEYRYDSDGEEISAQAPGVSALLGYQRSNSKGFWAGYAGVGYRNTTLSPDRPDAEVRGPKAACNCSERWIAALPKAGACRAGASVVWAGQLLDARQISAQLFHGLLLAGGGGHFQGDPDYHATKVGLVLDEWGVGKGVTANFKLGANKTRVSKPAVMRALSL